MRKIVYALIALATLCGAAALGNYNATPGSGLSFGSIVVSSTHYAQMFLCDLTTPAQCASVNAGGAVKVDGSAATQPVSGTVTANLGTIGSAATAANQTTEISSLATIATNTGAAIPAGTNVIGFTSNDPCQTLTKTYTPINISASGSAKIITGTSAKKTYICQINLVTNAANNVALTEGTVTNCGTGTAGIIGGTSAASGWNFSANGGISLGMGGYAVMQSATNADDVCLNPSASTQLSGGVYWVQQ